MGVEWAIVAAGLVVLTAAVLGWRARAAVGSEAERRHAAELDSRDATIASLRAELAAVRDQAGDGSAAAQGVVDAAARAAGAPPGPDGDRLLWGSDDAAAAGGGEAGPPASVA